MRSHFPTIALASLLVIGCSDGDQQRIADLENQLEETRVAELEMERGLEEKRVADLEEDRKKDLELQRTGGGERVVELYTSGQKKSEGHILDDGAAVGFWTEWHGNGQKMTEGTYKNDEKDGVFIEWDENGQKMAEETYKNGEPDGFWAAWYNNGQKAYEETYKNGEKYSERTYKNGKSKKSLK